MSERKPTAIPEPGKQESDEVNSHAMTDARAPVSLLRSRTGWFFRVVRVRLRFLLIVVFAGAIVSQWPILRGTWERWTWGFGRQQNWGRVSSANEYFCPMDPGVVSVWPAICPICNMDLVPRKKMDAVMLPEGVVARMQLSPYRIQLAGIRTAIVEPRRLEFEQTFTGVLRQSDDGSRGFETVVPMSLCAILMEPRSGDVRNLAMSGTVRAMARAVENSDPPRIQIVLDKSNALPEGSVVTATFLLPFGDAEDVLAVPQSAVIDRGNERLVYVETMPGMFDAVAVELGRRCGGYYPVTKGLKASQRVASTGAFLIDAETRLNPGLAAGYFGADQSGSKISSPPATLPSAKSQLPKSDLSKKTKLSHEDQVLADKQKVCPVTELPLNSMGGPVLVMVAGRKIFICCQGCEKRLQDEPEKYLVRIPQ